MFPATLVLRCPADPVRSRRYYIGRAEEAQTRQAASLIHRSTFRPLGRICYDLIGQDRALEQLFRVLSVQSQRFSVAPIVVVLCGTDSFPPF